MASNFEGKRYFRFSPRDQSILNGVHPPVQENHTMVSFASRTDGGIEAEPLATTNRLFAAKLARLRRASAQVPRLKKELEDENASLKQHTLN